MSTETRRRERLAELTRFALEKVDWLMGQFEFSVFHGEFEGQLGWTVRYSDPHDFIKAEAQKRWGVSDSTARDYARMVLAAIEPKIRSKLEEKKRQPQDRR